MKNKTAGRKEEVIKKVIMACQIDGVYLVDTLLEHSMTIEGIDCKEKKILKK